MKYFYDLFTYPKNIFSATTPGWIFEIRTHQFLKQGTPIQLFRICGRRAVKNLLYDNHTASTASLGAIVKKPEDSEEAISISDAVEESTSCSGQVVNEPTEDTGTVQTTSDSTTEVTTEPPVYMLAGIEVDDHGWQISGEHILSSCRPHAHPRSQSTVATVVATEATALVRTHVSARKHLDVDPVSIWHEGLVEERRDGCPRIH